MEYIESEWNGFRRLDFVLDGRNAVLVLPDATVPDNKWLLKTEYFGAFPEFEILMLKRGYGLAYVKNSTRWHKESDDCAKLSLCNFLKKEFGFNQKCLPVGMSCGGMHAVYFAAAHPERVAALYLDAPVLNLLSCPCGVGHSSNETYIEFNNATGFTVSDMINYRNHPIDKVGELLKNKIPVFLVCGDSDNIVPFDENGKFLANAYEKSGVPFSLVVKKGCGHHPHGLTDYSEMIKFFSEVY